VTTTPRKRAAKKATAAQPEVDAPNLPDPQRVERAPEGDLSVDQQLAEALAQLAAVTDLADAREERILLLEQQLADAIAANEPPRPTLVEVFVKEGRGKCLLCSCEKHTDSPDGGARCWGCNHDFGEHKRNPAGAVWQEVPAE